MKHGLVTLVVVMILKDTTTFQALFIVSLLWSWNITTAEINSGVHLLKSLIRQVPLFTSGGVGLCHVILVLVLRIGSCLHHCFLVALIISAEEVMFSSVSVCLSAKRIT